MDGRTDIRTDRPSYRDASTHLKKEIEEDCLINIKACQCKFDKPLTKRTFLLNLCLLSGSLIGSNSRSMTGLTLSSSLSKNWLVAVGL